MPKQDQISGKIILYGNPTCPTVPLARSILERAKVDFRYIDISRDAQARERVLEINYGYASVPTLVFPDGTTQSEPSHEELITKLESFGHKVKPTSLGDRAQVFIEHPIIFMIGILILANGIIRDEVFLTLSGVVIVVFRILIGILKGYRQRE